MFKRVRKKSNNYKCLFLLLMMILPLGVFAQTNLMDWGSSADLDSEKNRDVVKLTFEPEWLDSKVVVSGEVSIPAKSDDDIFQQMLAWMANTYSNIQESVEKMDFQGKRVLISQKYVSKEKTETGTFYTLSIAMQVKNSKLLFQAYDIKCHMHAKDKETEYKEKTFEEMFPGLKADKKKYRSIMKDFKSLNDQSISGMASDIIKAKEVIQITHWDEIYSHTLVVGMNAVECLLSIGKPEKINNLYREDEGSSEQWVYPGRKYAYFDHGKLVSFQF